MQVSDTDSHVNRNDWVHLRKTSTMTRVPTTAAAQHGGLHAALRSRLGDQR